MEMEKEPLPEVELYSIGPDEADYAAPLLTGEAVEEIKAGMASGMALLSDSTATHMRRTTLDLTGTEAV